MKHPITALSFQHKRFSRLDMLTVLLAELGKVQGSASPEWRMLGQGWKRLWGNVPADSFCFYSRIFVSCQVITLDPGRQHQPG